MKKSGFFLNLIGFFKSVHFILFFSVLIIFEVFPVIESVAQGNLLLMPRRVILEGSKRSQDMTLANTGADTAKYVVSIVQMRMKDDGSFEQITKPDSGQRFADKYLRFFPRTVTLAPNESQTVKMQMTKTEKLAPGEYRSHVYFRAMPKAIPLGEEETKKDTTSVSVQLVPIFGITVPVIIRVGETSVKVTLSDLKMEMVNDTVPRLKLKFDRVGNISVYGDIAVDYVSPQGKISRVANVKGIAVYTPNAYRRFQCNLDRNPGVDYHKGKLLINFVSTNDIKASKLANAELILH
jgi:P pilus assembly chaperone PapD